jgi:hypothetical protein
VVGGCIDINDINFLIVDKRWQLANLIEKEEFLNGIIDDHLA